MAERRPDVVCEKPRAFGGHDLRQAVRPQTGQRDRQRRLEGQARGFSLNQCSPSAVGTRRIADHGRVRRSSTSPLRSTRSSIHRVAWSS